MKYGKKLSLIFITIFIFLFKIDTVNAEEITCTYEMYPIGYDVDTSKKMPTLVYNYSSSKAKIVYNLYSSGSYSITSELKFGFEEKHPNIRDNNFSNNVKKSHKCPGYIYRQNAGNLVIISEEKFLNRLRTKFYSNSKNNYPLVLVEQDGEPKDYVKTVIDDAVNHWNKINSGDDSAIYDMEIKEKNEKIFIDSVKSSSIYNSKISTLPKWQNYLQLKSDEKDLEKKENESKYATSDYCYYYCPSVVCKNKTKANELAKCARECGKNQKLKCNEAYNECKNIASASAQDECIRTQLSQKGLEPSYVDIHSQEMMNLSSEIEKLTKAIKTAKASNINIEVGVHPYKLTCDDVVIFHQIWVIIIIFAPVLVIVMGTLDFGQAVISSNEDKMQKAWKKFPKRILALVLLILVPTLISLILSLTTDEGARDTSLMYCIINGGE